MALCLIFNAKSFWHLVDEFGRNYETKTCNIFSQASTFPVKIICTFQFLAFQDFIVFWSSKKGDVAGNISYYLDKPCVHCFPTQMNAKIPNQIFLL